MRLLLDENLSHRICPLLLHAGHVAVHVTEIGLASSVDVDVLAHARRDDRVLVTCDHDFVQLLFASGDAKPSLMLTRDVDTLPSDRIAELLIAAITPELERLLAAGAIATLNSSGVRARELPLRPSGA
jgi:predicted nuclease of predicted toxin-antitoxin system